MLSPHTHVALTYRPDDRPPSKRARRREPQLQPQVAMARARSRTRRALLRVRLFRPGQA
jgi:hypothetical protein